MSLRSASTKTTASTSAATQVGKNLGAVDKLAESAGVPVYFALIPTAADVWSYKLPSNAVTFDEEKFMSSVSQNTAAEYIDVAAELNAHADENIYYRTDHHWTSEGAYLGYRALMNAMGLEPVALGDGRGVTNSFYGTLYSSSGIRYIAPDTITAYVSGDGLSVVSYAGGTPEQSALYDESALSTKGKYEYFLGGNQPLCVITNSEAKNDMDLLVIRDSYADSEAPFLAESFASVHLIDLRYYRTSIAQYIADNDIDAVVVSYSVSNFITDKNLFLAAK